MVSFLPIVLLELVAPKKCFIPRNKEKLETKRKIKWSKSRDPAVSVGEKMALCYCLVLFMFWL